MSRSRATSTSHPTVPPRRPRPRRACPRSSPPLEPGAAPRYAPATMTDTIESPASVTTFRHFIAGEWCDSTSGETFESRNPADQRDIIGRFQQGTKADVAMAVKAAETALPMWRRTPAPKRGEILYRFGALMAEHKERLARAMTREMGKVLAEARGDVQEGIDIA